MNNFGTLMKFEIRKAMSRKSVWVTIGIMVLMTIYIITASWFGNFGDMSASQFHEKYKQAEKQFDSVQWSQENWDKISDTIENGDFSIIYDYTHQWFWDFTRNTDDRTYEDYENFRHSMVNANYADFQLTDNEIAYWENIGKDTITPTLGYTRCWENIVGNLHTLTAFFTLMIALIFCTSFSNEHTCKMDTLNLTSKYGRRKLFLAKFAAGELLAFMIGILVCLLILGISGGLYGFDGYHVSVQVNYVDSMYPLTMGQTTLICLGLIILSGLMTAAIVMTLSECFRNSIVPLAVIFLTIIMTFAISQGLPRAILQIMYYIPDLRIGQLALADERLVLGMNAFQFSYILYPALTIICVIICWQSYRHYQIQGR